IGAMTTISELIQHRALGIDHPVLIEAARRLGGVQIRNAATVAGNLCNCSPCADTALPLLILDARVRLQNPQESRDIPLHELFVGPGESCIAPGEIMTDIIVDPPETAARATSFKKGRVKMDLAIASVAVLLIMEENMCRKARIAAGSVAPVPIRLHNVEALLENKPLSREIVNEAGELAAMCVTPITDIRSTEDYRRHLVGVFVRRAIEKLAGLHH
ncbi:MAG: FAD binding domain-containing protein, partial [Candidatus Latescibacterota bacterium]